MSRLRDHSETGYEMVCFVTLNEANEKGKRGGKGIGCIWESE